MFVEGAAMRGSLVKATSEIGILYQPWRPWQRRSAVLAGHLRGCSREVIACVYEVQFIKLLVFRIRLENMR